MPISLAKKKAAPLPSNSGGGGGGDGKPGAPLGFLAAFLAAGAFVAQMYAPPQYAVLAFQVLGGLAGLVGAFGVLGAIKALRAGPKGSAALSLLLGIGAVGAVAFGFSRPTTTPPPGPEQATGPGETASAVAGTNAPASTNAVASAAAPQPVTVDDAPQDTVINPIRIQRLLPVTQRTSLMKARTGELPPPEPKPKIKEIKTAKATPAKPEPVVPKQPAVDPEFPELANLAPSIELPPPVEPTVLPDEPPMTFREATLKTFEEINVAARNFEAVNNLDIAQLLDVSGMANSDVVAQRYRRVALWLERQAAFKQIVQSADNVYELRLRRANTPADKVATTMARFRETREKLYDTTLTRTTEARRLNTAVAGVLKVLGDNFESWEYDCKSKRLVFEDRSIATNYQGAIEQIKKASAPAPGS